jgi:hypothetical protein
MSKFADQERGLQHAHDYAALCDGRKEALCIAC